MQRQHRVLHFTLERRYESTWLASSRQRGHGPLRPRLDRIRYLNDRLLVGRRHSVYLFEDFFELALIHFDRPPNVYLEPAIGP